jgi:hypothetical protein
MSLRGTLRSNLLYKGDSTSMKITSARGDCFVGISTLSCLNPPRNNVLIVDRLNQKGDLLTGRPSCYVISRRRQWCLKFPSTARRRRRSAHSQSGRG